MSAIDISTAIGISSEFLKAAKKIWDKRKKKNGKEFTILNFSHTLSDRSIALIDEKFFGNYEIIDVKPPTADPEKMVKAAEEIVLEALKQCNIQNIKLGKYIVIPPGHSGMAVIVTAILHGMCGHFPSIWFTKPLDHGFVLTDNYIVLKNIRTNARDALE